MLRSRIPAAAVLLSLAVLLAACASAPRREAPPRNPDRTDEPEFAAAAAEAARIREFETQADALAAGVYEPFAHPDSVAPAAPARRAAPPPAAAVAPVPAPVQGTPDPPGTYNREEQFAWTLQAGAFDSETGAFVRLRQLALDFPDLPRWHIARDGRYHVYVGRFPDRRDAEGLQARAVERGYADAWVTVAP